MLVIAFGLNGQDASAEHTCGASRKFPSDVLVDFDMTYQGKEIELIYNLDENKIRLLVEDGGFLENFNFIVNGYSPLPEAVALAWEHESIIQYLSKESDFYQEFVLRNPDSKTLAQFKSDLKKILNCRYGSIKVISEGVDFLEYEANGMRFYHGFFLAPKMHEKETHTSDIASIEFIGYSSIKNYETRKSTYIKTFHNSRGVLQKHVRERGITPIS
ncbi:hypothetical protein PVA46_06335 [Entomospira culicis]|nr:hypothetical protein PVA46_06335 [Entomospira culicis]